MKEPFDEDKGRSLSKEEIDQFLFGLECSFYLKQLDKKIAHLEEQQKQHRARHPIFYFFKTLLTHHTP